jgi:hypothetical protein
MVPGGVKGSPPTDPREANYCCCFMLTVLLAAPRRLALEQLAATLVVENAEDKWCGIQAGTQAISP